MKIRKNGVVIYAVFSCNIATENGIILNKKIVGGVMFVCSVRASSIKFFAAVALAVAIFFAVVLGSNTVFATASAGEVDFTGMKSDEDRIAFIRSFGVEVSGGAAEEVDFVMPENFDRVMLGYNEIQKQQGLDLSKYSKKKVTRYTYKVTNYDGYEGEVFANLLVYRNRIIGCDVSSGDPEGFVEPLIK